MDWILWGIYGLAAGSAANAVIDRLPREESWFAGRSHCDKCGHTLGWKDLIPVVSYIGLGGKCRYCRSPIPYRNLVVELVTAGGFIFFSVQCPIFSVQCPMSNVQSILLAVMWWVSVVIAFMDWETQMVAEVMVGVWAILVIIYHLTIYHLSFNLIFNFLLPGAALGVGIIGGIWAVSKGKAMGFGDVEIAAVLGFWLGAAGTLVALWMAFVLGGFAGGWLLAAGKRKLKSRIAFGPFLVIGGWMAYWWGKTIINYLTI